MNYTLGRKSQSLKKRAARNKGRAYSRPLHLGLTGGLASGKSSALKIFKALGWKTISADEIVHQIYSEKGESLERLRQEATQSPRALKKLEAWIHPQVRKRVRKDLKENEGRSVVVEVPLLFEGKLASAFDAVLFVYAPKSLRKKRAVKRGMSPKLFEKLDSRQYSAKEKAKLSDLVLLNLDKKKLRQQILAFQKLSCPLKRAATISKSIK
ncbi:MAG: dephospho-CoA kinase [Bradymonadales bacterium]|nr:MAG: dephospho-CoA kinase [Bradymonadales bacterium]